MMFRWRKDPGGVRVLRAGTLDADLAKVKNAGGSTGWSVTYYVGDKPFKDSGFATATEAEEAAERRIEHVWRMMGSQH